MNDRQKNVAQHCNGVRTSAEIAKLCGDKQKYVQEVMLKFDLPRRRRGSATGKLNGKYRHGRRIDRDGYVLVTAPDDHPYARQRTGRPQKLIYEHRLMMEQKIGRYLLPKETVDHIDGLRLHNDPSNLRLFDSNADHLKATISNQVPRWSKAGREQIGKRLNSRPSQPVNTYDRMKKSGDARLRQILLSLLSLGKGSPYLLGTSHHLEKAGIADFSRSNLTRELEQLSQRYA